jgi:hypothetical protein
LGRGFFHGDGVDVAAERDRRLQPCFDRRDLDEVAELIAHGAQEGCQASRVHLAHPPDVPAEVALGHEVA